MSEEELSEEEIKKLNADSEKAYKTPDSMVVPGLKPKKYICDACGHEEIGGANPQHCDQSMKASYS